MLSGVSTDIPLPLAWSVISGQSSADRLPGGMPSEETRLSSFPLVQLGFDRILKVRLKLYSSWRELERQTVNSTRLGKTSPERSHELLCIDHEKSRGQHKPTRSKQQTNSVRPTITSQYEAFWSLAPSLHKRPHLTPW